MDVRKLVKSGHASLVLAIPKGWLTKHNLKAGDLVYIDESHGQLIIKHEKQEAKVSQREIVLNVDGMKPEIIPFEIATAYMSNYRYIIVKGKTLPKVLEIVKDSIVELVALELIDESSERVVARNFLNINDIDTKILVRRMDNIIRSMIMDTKDAVKDPSIIPAIVNRDKEVNRLTFLMYKILKAVHCDRNLMRKLNLSELDILRLWGTNIHLEKIGDRVKHAAKIIPDMKPKEKTEFLKFYTEIEKMYTDVMKASYQNSLSLADDASIRRKAVLKSIDAYINKHKSYAAAEIAINTFSMIQLVNNIARLLRYLKS